MAVIGPGCDSGVSSGPRISVTFDPAFLRVSSIIIIAYLLQA